MSGKPAVRAFFDEPTNTVSYLVADPATRRAAVIDPVLDYDPKSGEVDTRSVEADPRGRARGRLHDRLVARDPCPCRPSVGCAVRQGEDRRQDRHRRAHQRGAAHLPAGVQRHRHLKADGSDFDHLFKDGERFKIGDLEVEVLYTPGHTPACVSYKIGDAVFVGDTLFMPDYGTARADFPGGDARKLYRSIRRLLALPPETRLFMCHDYKAPGRDPYAWETTVARAAREQCPRAGRRRARMNSSPCAMRATRRSPRPTLLLPSIQVNIRAGRFPPAEANGVRYLKIPVKFKGGEPAAA